MLWATDKTDLFRQLEIISEFYCFHKSNLSNFWVSAWENQKAMKTGKIILERIAKYVNHLFSPKND